MGYRRYTRSFGNKDLEIELKSRAVWGRKTNEPRARRRQEDKSWAGPIPGDATLTLPNIFARQILLLDGKFRVSTRSSGYRWVIRINRAVIQDTIREDAHPCHSQKSHPFFLPAVTVKCNDF